MDLATPSARYLGASDRQLLAAFLCSGGAWFEDDVELFIRNRLMDQHEWRSPHTDHTLIGLEIVGHGLVAVGSHEQDFVVIDGEDARSIYLECGAVATHLQGAVLADVKPLDEGRPVTLGRYLMEVLLSDASERPRLPIVRTAIARDNLRSLRLCTRVGLIEERDDADERFVQRLGYLPT